MIKSNADYAGLKYPSIIQGGMGVGVSNWRLARAVAKCGQLGVVSGTALDTVLVRRLQDGDLDGSIRRAMAAFPYPEMVEPILKRWYQPEGRKPDAPYRLKALPTVSMIRADEELLIVANFVEVFLAKEGHDALIGINFLEKIQLPTLPSLFGAMLAGVDVVIMGGGIPLAIPRVLDALSELEPVEMKLNLVGAKKAHDHLISFHPGTYVSAAQPKLKRPLFFPVIASEILAKTMVKKAGGRVDGFIVESASAGGHNAPPRKEGVYGPKDVCDLDQLASLGLPFWLAGGCGTPERLAEAQKHGARGIQAGTIFACADESGILPEIKAEIVRLHHEGRLKVVTDFEASPTGYPIKRAELSYSRLPKSCRSCDLGYLRHVYEKADGTLSYRCPASPRKPFLAHGGSKEEAIGKECLCNGLLSTVGLGQIRRGMKVPPFVTWGDDLSFLGKLTTASRSHYKVDDAMKYILLGEKGDVFNNFGV